MKKKSLFIICLFFLFSSCRTVFYGESKVINGVVGCEDKCAEWGMELVGMVAMGEYSDGCICVKKGEDISVNDIGKAVLISASGVSSVTPAVITQMQQMEEESHVIEN